MDRAKVAEVLNEIALLLRLKGESPFRIRAYENGARAIELLEEDLYTLVQENRLGQIKGIGKTLAQGIEELVTTGSLAYHEELKGEFPEALFDLFRVPGLGPKRVQTLYEKLGITSLGELEYACRENRLLILPGFGEKTQQNILRGIDHLKHYQSRFLYSEAQPIAEAIVREMLEQPGVIEAHAAGSLRRCKEIVGDIDILASSLWPVSLMDWFTSMDYVDTITGKGDTKSSVKLKNGINADLRVVSPEQYPYALHHFTGSKEHNTAMRHIARSRGIKMNEYGLLRGEEETPISCRNEEEIFKFFGMDYIPPELREGGGEIQAAMEGNLPKLIEMEDIKGILHVHTTYSDGRASLREMVDEALRLGYHYIGISDHSQSAYYANGLTPEDIKRQHEEIDELNQLYNGRIRILKGIESDIQPDGSLDYPDEILASFDFVIASVHSGFSMDKETMTRRLLKAMDNPHTTILGHPTGRLLLSREGYPLDMEAVLEGAAKRGVAIDINAKPYRLDLD